jgi:hypothetical protein
VEVPTTFPKSVIEASALRSTFDTQYEFEVGAVCMRSRASQAARASLSEGQRLVARAQHALFGESSVQKRKQQVQS